MAKLKAPFLSFGATGTVGQALTVSGHKGLHVAKTIPTHPDARTAAQLAQRELYSHARDYWLTLTPTEKATLLTEGRPSHITGYNLLLHRYLKDLLSLEAWWPLNDRPGAVADDFSLHETDGTVFGCIPTPDYCGQINNAFLFDGINDRVVATTPQLNFTSQDFSITLRIYQTTDGSVQVIIQRGARNDDGWELFLSTTRMIRFRTSQFGSHQESTTFAGGLPLAAWTTLGISRSGPDALIYVNGIHTQLVYGTHIDPETSPRPCALGVAFDLASWPLAALVCDVKLYSRALTPPQHLAHHQRYCVHPPR